MYLYSCITVMALSYQRTPGHVPHFQADDGGDQGQQIVNKPWQGTCCGGCLSVHFCSTFVHGVQSVWTACMISLTWLMSLAHYSQSLQYCL